MLFTLVLVGGATRVTDSGLSITEWEPVIGVFPPLSLESWTLEFEKYKKIPEYTLVNYQMSLSEFKVIDNLIIPQLLAGKEYKESNAHAEQYTPAVSCEGDIFWPESAFVEVRLEVCLELLCLIWDLLDLPIQLSRIF